jgi:transposase-like protein
MMTKISYGGYRFPPEIIQQAIWLYVRFTLSFRDVEDLLAERGILVSYESVRRWVNHFGPMIAADLRKRRPKPHTIWHLDEVYLKIDGRMVYLWRAVDAEGEVLDVLVQTKRNKRAALKLMRKLLKKYGFVPDKLITDELRSYAAATGHLGIGWPAYPRAIVIRLFAFDRQAPLLIERSFPRSPAAYGPLDVLRLKADGDSFFGGTPADVGPGREKRPSPIEHHRDYSGDVETSPLFYR